MRECGAEAIGVAAGLHDEGVEGQPVDYRGRSAGIGEGLAPLAERRVGGNRDRGALFAFGQDLEQQLSATAVQVQVAELVETQQVVAAVAGHRA